MKKFMVRGIVAVLLVVVFGPTMMDDGPRPPFCPPGSTCN